MKTERMVTRDQGWGRKTALVLHGNRAWNDENVLMGGDRALVHSVGGSLS